MMKKFVPLSSNKSPTNNPYEVRTYFGEVNKTEWKIDPACKIDRKCPPNSTISQVITLEDEIHRLTEKVKESRYSRPSKKKCAIYDDFTVCTATQRTPEELKTHAVMREFYLKVKEDRDQLVHDGRTWRPKPLDIIYLPDALGRGEGEEEEEEESEPEFYDGEGEEEEEKKKKPVKPQFASLSCSVDAIYIPPQKLLELKRPKSGLFHNETEPPKIPNDGIAYQKYNPRVLQKEFDMQELPKVDLVEGRAPDDLWTWNVGLQQRESELDAAYLFSQLPKFDCDRWKVAKYAIPKDLDKTFTAVIVFGNSAIKPDPPPKKREFYIRPREIACIFVGYAESFQLNPDFWIPKTMNSILKRGEKLRKLSENLNYKATDMDFDIINQIPERKATIGLRFHYSGTIISDPNLYKVLSFFFKKYNAALFVGKNMYLLIWKRCLNSFYVFDPNGRDELCQRNFEEGKCSLMDTQYVEHLVHLIVNCSNAKMSDKFTLYEIFLKNFGKIDEPMPKFEDKHMKRIWAVVNNAYALIPSYKEGLSPPNSAIEQNASMIVSLVGMIYANIQMPMKWRMQTIDDIIKFGMKYNRHLRLKYRLRKYNEQLNILDMPNALMMVSYRCFVKKFPFYYSGHVAECNTFKESQLTKALQDLFTGSDFDACLVQVDNSVLAVWKDAQIFYVFDPFRRGNAGQVLDPDDYRSIGAACLQMHTNLDSLLRVLYQKALQMRRGGKLFIHAYIIGCIKPKYDFVGKNKYPNLELLPPKYRMDFDDRLTVSMKSINKPKPKPEPEIARLKDEERLPEFDDDEVVESVFADLVRELIDGFEEPIIKRPQLYKQVKKVLLRTDSEYLENLKHQLVHRKDYDQLYAIDENVPEPLKTIPTIEQELEMPSNYELLPDGIWALFGQTDVPDLNDETLSKLAGLLASLVTIALTAKYKISTWNSTLIEFSLDSVNYFSNDFTNYESALMSLLSKKAPVMGVGDDVIELKVLKIIKSKVTKPLKEVLLKILNEHKRVLVLCQRFSCAIIKQYNFLYLFMGYPCNSTAYRKYGNGPACILRVLELDAIMRRMEFACNPAGCEITNYVIFAFKAKLMNIPKFNKWPMRKQKEMFEEALARKTKDEQVNAAKMKFLDDTLKKERKRIKAFYREKAGIPPPRREKQIMYDMEGNVIEEAEMEGEFEEVEEEEIVEPKHKPGTKLRIPKLETFVPKPVLYGYHMRVKDCLFKIQGSTALEGRDAYSMEEIKVCFFASVLSILNVIVRPLPEWHSQRIDRVIESAKNITERLDDMDMAPQRIIKNVTVDDFMFDVWVKTYKPPGVEGMPFISHLRKAVHDNKYLLLFNGNTTYTIYHDEHLHLFDPYGSMVKLGGNDEAGQEEEDKKKHCPRGVKRYGERDTASWVLFLYLEDLLKYIDERTSNADWQKQLEYRFFTVDIMSYKKAPRNARILQLLTDLSVPPRCDATARYGKGEEDICARMESMAWLELEKCLPAWSRLHRRNTAGRYRNMSITKFKKFDIEIDGRLWSIWGNLHPEAPVFDATHRGKSYLACYVVGLCAATVYHLMDWSPSLIDTIVINGDRFHEESLKDIKKKDYEFSLEDLGTECTLQNLKFLVNIQFVVYGKLYIQPQHGRMNLSEALIYFFSFFRFGILQCGTRALAIGYTPQHDGGYFMFDCQSKDHPLFPKDQGAAYMLRTRHLQVLLYCIIVTLNVPYYNVEFTIHEVQIVPDTELGEEEADELLPAPDPE